MLQRLFFYILIIITSFTSYSQNRFEKKGKPRTFFPQYSGEKKWKMYFAFDARRSFLLQQQIKINGFRVGVAFKGVHRFGIGIYSLTDKISIDGITVKNPDAHESPNVRVSFGITTLFYERVFYKTKRWEVSFPAFIGTGSINSEYKNNLGNYKNLKKNNFSVIGVGINTHYYIFSWLSPRIMLGYRFSFNADDKIASGFSKPVYAIGISLNPFEAYRSYKNWRTDRKEKPITQ